MSGAFANLQSPHLEKLRRHLPWILLGLTILFVAVVRIRLREMPLERDEGEYAYAGQLLLQGIPPYKLAYNMKLPGTYGAYALMMAVFGQSPSGVHIGLLLVNAAAIVLVFLLGRKLMDDVAGAVAAVAYAFMSLSPSVVGLAAHATHFVVVPALGGALLLLRAADTGRWRVSFVCGLLFGIAYIMKQHGVMFGAFGFLFLLWARARVQKERFTWSKIRARSVPFDWAKYARECGPYLLGLLCPYVLMVIALWAAGVFPQFYFWTVKYASKYITALPLRNASDLFRQSLEIVTSPSLFFWLLAALGAILMWSYKRGTSRLRFFLVGWLLFSCFSISIGLYFREHYFILLLPALSLLAGLAVSRGVYLLKHTQSVERLLAVPALGLLLIGLATSLILHGEIWFGMSPVKATRQIYGNTLYPEALRLGEFIRTNTPAQVSIAVIGSEPEIYFYSRRHSATGYIYMYPLMEAHDYALRMQEDMIREVETARPEYIVYVDLNESWLPWPSAKPNLQNWWPKYWTANYSLVRTKEIEVEKRDEVASNPARPGSLLLFKRKSSAVQ